MVRFDVNGQGALRSPRRWGPGRNHWVRTVDTARGDTRSAMRRGGHRGSRTPRGNTTSRTGRSDTATPGRRMRAGTSRSQREQTAGSGPSARGSSRVQRSWRRQSFRQSSQHDTHLIERQFARRRGASDQVQTVDEIQFGHERAKTTPQTIADHRIAHGSVDRERHLSGVRRRIGKVRTPEGLDPYPATTAAEPLEVVSGLDPTDQADRRARPLSRRDFNTARPARVLIRARKPCFLERRRALG